MVTVSPASVKMVPYYTGILQKKIHLVSVLEAPARMTLCLVPEATNQACVVEG